MENGKPKLIVAAVRNYEWVVRFLALSVASEDKFGVTSNVQFVGCAPQHKSVNELMMYLAVFGTHLPPMLWARKLCRLCVLGWRRSPSEIFSLHTVNWSHARILHSPSIVWANLRPRMGFEDAFYLFCCAAHTSTVRWIIREIYRFHVFAWVRFPVFERSNGPTNTKCWMRNSLWAPEFGIRLAASVFAYGKSCSWFNCGREITKYPCCRYIHSLGIGLPLAKWCLRNAGILLTTHLTSYCYLLFVGIGSALCEPSSHRSKQNIAPKRKASETKFERCGCLDRQHCCDARRRNRTAKREILACGC